MKELEIVNAAVVLPRAPNETHIDAAVACLHCLNFLVKSNSGCRRCRNLKCARGLGRMPSDEIVETGIFQAHAVRNSVLAAQGVCSSIGQSINNPTKLHAPYLLRCAWEPTATADSVMARTPNPDDFPSHITLTITPPPNNKPPVNILILLHGLGDTHTSFTNLGRQLNLPETLCISLQAPVSLPAALDFGHEGFHWGDDIVFDNSTGGIDVVDVPYKKSIQLLLEEVILGVLVEKCGYKLRDIVLFGLGQGGVVSLCAAKKCVDMGIVGEFGGVVSLGGPLANAFKYKAGESKVKTPVLVVHGSSGSTITSFNADAIKEAFESAEIHAWPRSGDGMPTSREEMLPVMQFLARRLRSRVGVPSGAVEI